MPGFRETFPHFQRGPKSSPERGRALRAPRDPQIQRGGVPKMRLNPHFGWENPAFFAFLPQKRGLSFIRVGRGLVASSAYGRGYANCLLYAN